MFTWAGVILQLLKLLNWMIEKGQQEKWMNEGEQRQIARASAEVVTKQEFARETLKDIQRLSDAGVDELLRTLAGSSKAGGSGG